MELKGITREWDSLKKDAAARAASAAPYVKEGKIVDAKDADRFTGGCYQTR